MRIRKLFYNNTIIRGNQHIIDHTPHEYIDMSINRTYFQETEEAVVDAMCDDLEGILNKLKEVQKKIKDSKLNENDSKVELAKVLTKTKISN